MGYNLIRLGLGLGSGLVPNPVAEIAMAMRNRTKVPPFYFSFHY